jgi:hypothetical protein
MFGEIFKSWCAAWLDGEGTIVYNDCGSMRIEITQNDIRPLLIIQKKYGGKVILVGKNRPNAHRLRFTVQESLRFLQDVLPYLIVKKDKAEIALAKYGQCRHGARI